MAASLARVPWPMSRERRSGQRSGCCAARSRMVDAVLLGPSELLRPIPPLGLIPLFILWFGVGELSKVLLIFLSVLLIMMVNAQAGVRSCSLDSPSRGAVDGGRSLADLPLRRAALLRYRRS